MLLKKNNNNMNHVSIVISMIVISMIIILSSTTTSSSWRVEALLHADQAGRFDWHRMLLGKPTVELSNDGLVVFHRVAGKRAASLYMGTEKNVVAALNPKNGIIMWRHLLEKNDKLLYLSADEQTVMTVSGMHSHHHVRLWDSMTGSIVWDYELLTAAVESAHNDGGTDSVTVPVSGSSVDDILVLTPDGVLTRLSGKLGSQLWQTALHICPNTVFSRIITSRNSVFAVGFKSVGADRALAIVEVDLKTGRRVKELFKEVYHYFPRSLRPPALYPEFFFLAGSGNETFVVWNSAGGSSPVKLLSLGSASETIFDIDVQAALKSESADHYALPLEKRGHAFIIKSSDIESAISKFSPGNGLELIHRFPDTKAVEHSTSSLFTLALGEKCRPLAARVFIDSPTTSTAVIDLYDMETGEILGPVDVPVPSIHDGAWTHVFLDAVSTPRGGASSPFRLLALSQSGAVSMIKPGEVLWSRDEALADTAGFVFVDLPEPQLLSLEKDELDEPLMDTEALSPLNRYLRRWTSHVNKLQTFFAHAPETMTHILSRTASPKAQAVNASDLVFRDKLGFRKLALFASKSGKLQAMETERGAVIWSRWIGASGVVRRIELVRSVVVKFPPVVTVILETQKTTEFFSIDALTGQDFAATVSRSEHYKQIIPLPVKESLDHLDVLALVSDDNTVRLHPSTPESATAFESIRNSFYFYQTQLNGSRVDGFVCNVRQMDKNGIFYTTAPTWSVKFVSGEKVAAIAKRHGSEKHSSMGRVLGNRSVLYKYLNPNLLALATVKETPSARTTNVYLYLLDTVTGSIYHRSSYLGAGHAAPGLDSIHVLQSDHSVFLSYFNHGPDAADLVQEMEPIATTADADAVSAHSHDVQSKKKKRRQSRKRGVVNTAPDVKGVEIVALEVYESKTPDSRMKGDEYSSFDVRRPQVLSQSFVFPHVVTALGVTSTGAGITTREILFGLGSGQLLGVNRRFLDPRRPMGTLTNDDKEEMLIPYRPLIDYNPRDVASYSLEIVGIEHIVSSPSSLESTSLVLAYGVDIFFARRSPSKSFDVLSEDFNYSSLILTMVALVASIQVAKHFAQRKRLNDQWL